MRPKMDWNISFNVVNNTMGGVFSLTFLWTLVTFLVESAHWDVVPVLQILIILRCRRDPGPGRHSVSATPKLSENKARVRVTPCSDNILTRIPLPRKLARITSGCIGAALGRLPVTGSQNTSYMIYSSFLLYFAFVKILWFEFKWF